MADVKLSSLTELAATPAINDEIYIRDVSEAASNESKRITIANLIDLRLGSLGASAYVIASDAPATIKAYAVILEAAGFPVWVCSGANDDVQIQAAIDALPAGGGRIVCTEGIFYIAANVSVTGDNIAIEGMGNSTEWRRTNNAAVDMLTISGTGDSVRNMYLNGNSQWGGGPNAGGDSETTEDVIVTTGSDRLKLENLLIKHAPRHGIYGADIHPGFGAELLTISNVEVRYCNAGAGMFMWYPAGIFAYNLHLRESHNATTGKGLELHNGNENYFVNIDIDSNQSSGMRIDDSGSTTFLGGYVGGNVGHGVEVLGAFMGAIIPSFTCKGVTFKGNNAGESGFADIVIAPDGTGIRNAIIEGNCFEYFTAGRSDIGIWLTGKVDYSVITGNAIAPGYATPISFSGYTGAGNNISGNRGWVTENSGSDTLINANTTRVVAHGLSATPTVINICFKENPTNAIGDWWVDTVGATNFTFHGVDPGASNLDFYWEAKVR